MSGPGHRRLRTRATAAVVAGLISCRSLQQADPVSWTDVREQTSCEALNPAYCTGAYGFALTKDGIYQVGPAPDGIQVNAAITDSERNQLSADVASLSGDLTTARCDSAGTVPGVSDAV